MLDTDTGNLEVNSVFITIRSMRDTNKFHFFFIFRISFLYHRKRESASWIVREGRSVREREREGGGGGGGGERDGSDITSVALKLAVKFASFLAIN